MHHRLECNFYREKNGWLHWQLDLPHITCYITDLKACQELRGYGKEPLSLKIKRFHFVDYKPNSSDGRTIPNSFVCNICIMKCFKSICRLEELRGFHKLEENTLSYIKMTKKIRKLLSRTDAEFTDTAVYWSIKKKISVLDCLKKAVFTLTTNRVCHCLPFVTRGGNSTSCRQITSPTQIKNVVYCYFCKIKRKHISGPKRRERSKPMDFLLDTCPSASVTKSTRFSYTPRTFYPDLFLWSSNLGSHGVKPGL